MYDNTYTTMQGYVEQNRSRYQELWVLQTFLFLEFFGMFEGNPLMFHKARHIHRNLVDAMRMLQMSHDGGCENTASESSEDEDNEEGMLLENVNLLEQRWHDFAKIESKKRYVVGPISYGCAKVIGVYIPYISLTHNYPFFVTRGQCFHHSRSSTICLVLKKFGWLQHAYCGRLVRDNNTTHRKKPICSMRCHRRKVSFMKFHKPY